MQLLLHLREGVGVPAGGAPRVECSLDALAAPARAQAHDPWSKNWTSRERIQIASGPCPQGRAGRSGRERVAEAAHPVHVRVPGVAGDLVLEHREDVVADDLRRDLPGVGSPRVEAASKLSETSSSSSTPTSERRPDQSREPPPSSQNTLSLRAKPARTASTHRLSHCSVSQEVRDDLGAVARQDRLGMELHALERELAVPRRPSPRRRPRPSPRARRAPRRPRASGSAPRRTATGSPRARRLPRGSPTRPRRGPARPAPPFRRTP